MEVFLQTETVIIELMLIVALVALVVRQLRIPYTVALVVTGLVLTVNKSLYFEMTPSLIMALLVPPLVFHAAFHISFADLRRDLPGIALLAVPGVIVTTAIVGGFVAGTTQLGLPLALVFGALIAATDPVAVVAVFRTLGVPKRLGVLVEGESLLNDGTAIVLFNLVLASALAGHVDPLGGVADFVWVSAGGILVGLALGWVVAQIIARVDDYLIETTLTTVLAFGSYLVAERLHVSGVLAVVAAGLINGELGPAGMSPTTRIVLFNFWEYVAFVANSLIFLLIGLRIDVWALLAVWQPIVGAVVAVLLARAVVVYGLGLVANRIGEPLPIRWQHVMAWSGLRGAVSLALALSLPAELGTQRDLLLVMSFGVVLFTLLAQGTTVGLLLRRLHVGTERSEAVIDFEKRHALLATLRAGDTYLRRLHAQGLISDYTWEPLREDLARREGELTGQVHELLRANTEIAAEERAMASRQLLLAQRGELLARRRDGLVSDEVFDELVREIDEALGTDEEGRLTEP
ncbi:MAG: Na+/H+ antiporter [Chloroflexota bacterium]